MISVCKVGNSVEVFYNVRGRAWENREGKTLWFTSFTRMESKRVQRGSSGRGSVSRQRR